MTIKVSERIRTTGVFLSMRVKAVILLSMNGRKYRTKAIKTVICVKGIESVALTGEAENQLEVIGRRRTFDAALLVRLLRKKVGHADLISICPSRCPNDRSQRIGNSSTNGEVRKPRLHFPWLKLKRLPKLFIGCFKPSTSVKNSKRLGDRSSKWEPAGNQDFSTGSGSVNPKLPEIRNPLDSDLETTNSGCYKPSTSVKNSKRLGHRSSKWEPAGNQDFSTGSGSVNPKLPEIRPLDSDLETTNSDGEVREPRLHLPSLRLERDYKMACSSSNNSNIRLKRRLCDCGRTAARHTVKSKYVSEEHYNYFKFADDNDDDEIFNVTPRTSIRSEEFNDRSTMVYEMDNEFEEHGKRLRRAEMKLNVMLYVIVFCIIFYFIM